MAKYSPEFKLHVVNEYLQGTLGYRLLAKKYNIPSKSQIETWVRQYKQTGRSGVQRKEKQEYTGEFKLNVLNDMKTTGQIETYDKAVIAADPFHQAVR